MAKPAKSRKAKSKSRNAAVDSAAVESLPANSGVSADDTSATSDAYRSLNRDPAEIAAAQAKTGPRKIGLAFSLTLFSLWLAFLAYVAYKVVTQ